MRSKSKFYNGNPEEDRMPEDVATNECDEIGIVHAICIKVCLFILSISYTFLMWKYTGSLLSSV